MPDIYEARENELTYMAYRYLVITLRHYIKHSGNHIDGSFVRKLEDLANNAEILKEVFAP